jgi:hypothetical protein
MRNSTTTNGSKPNRRRRAIIMIRCFHSEKTRMRRYAKQQRLSLSGLLLGLARERIAVEPPPPEPAA